MSKPSRLARPSPGSKLPSSRRDACAGRARIVSVGEKVMRMGGERDISVQRPSVHGTTHAQTHQNTNVKEQDEVAQPRSKMSKGSTATVTQQQVFEQSKCHEGDIHRWIHRHTYVVLLLFGFWSR